MDDINTLVARNLKRIRRERKLSLDKLAELSGISKSMLGQIERGESSPTISVVWKIANGLKLPFTSLLSVPQPDISTLEKSDIEPFTEDAGKYRLYPFFPIEEGQSFEFYYLEIDAGGRLSAKPHPQGSQEFIVISQGTLVVTVGEEEYRLETDHAMRFKADREHGYFNPGNELTKINMVIHYTE